MSIPASRTNNEAKMAEIEITTSQPEPLHLPVSKKYLTEAEVADLLGCTVRAFRQRKNRPR